MLNRSSQHSALLTGNVLPANEILADHTHRKIRYHQLRFLTPFPFIDRKLSYHIYLIIQQFFFLSTKTKSDRIKLTRCIGKDKFQMLLVCSDFDIFCLDLSKSKTEAKDYPYQMAPNSFSSSIRSTVLHLAAILHQFSTQALSSSRI